MGVRIADETRQLKGLAVGVEDTDAVNVAQLRLIQQPFLYTDKNGNVINMNNYVNINGELYDLADIENGEVIEGKTPIYKADDIIISSKDLLSGKIKDSPSIVANVKAGENDTDAVNVSQLKELQQNLTDIGNNIQNIT